MTGIWVFNVAGVLIALGINLAVATSLLNVYFARPSARRVLWIAVGCLLVAPAYLWSIGWLSFLGGAATFVAIACGIVSASLIPHAWTYVTWGSAKLRWTITIATVAVGAVTIGRPPRDTILVMVSGLALITIPLAIKAIRSAVSASGNREARGHAISWLFIFATIPIDASAVARGLPPDTTIRVAALGMSVFIISNLLTLGRELVDTLGRAEQLNVELEAKIDQLERGAAEINSLNVELRRQVAERSRDLSEALGRGVAHVRRGTIAVGDVFEGRYRVVRLLGRGGMGAVYEATRITDNRRVAIKVLAGEPTPAVASRFAREAEIAATVHDTHVVAILDIGVAQSGVLFLAMEYIDGPSIEQMRDRFGDPGWAVPILRQLTTGLAALHAKNVIHRDLKPANVLLAGGAAVKIADFGISRFDEREVDAAADTAPLAIDKTRLTETGAWIGTPLYMPPEAVRGTVRAPADIFALGVMAYEMLDGRTPFPIPPIYDSIAGRPLPRAPLLACVDRSVADVLRDMVAEDPTRRPTIATICAALDAAVGRPSRPPSTPGRDDDEALRSTDQA